MLSAAVSHAPSRIVSSVQLQKSNVHVSDPEIEGMSKKMPVYGTLALQRHVRAESRYSCLRVVIRAIMCLLCSKRSRISAHRTQWLLSLSSMEL